MAKIIMKPAVQETLRSMQIGETLVIKYRTANQIAVATAISRLRKESLDFLYTVKDQPTGIKVTRTK